MIRRLRGVRSRLILVKMLVAATTAACSHGRAPGSRPLASPPTRTQPSASAVGGSSRNGSPRMIIVPRNALQDREVVSIDLQGFRPEEKVWLSECAPTQTPSRKTGCGDQVATEQFAVTDSTGTRSGVRYRIFATVTGHHCRPRCALAAVGNNELVAVNIYFG